jgi:hypothetical protein
MPELLQLFDNTNVLVWHGHCALIELPDKLTPIHCVNFPFTWSQITQRCEVYRGYDSPQLFREDTLKRMRWLDSELSKIQFNVRSRKPSSDDDNDPGCE